MVNKVVSAIHREDQRKPFKPLTKFRIHLCSARVTQLHPFILAALRRSNGKIAQEWFSNVRNDILAGLVVALALIPEAIAFSIIAGVDP